MLTGRNIHVIRFIYIVISRHNISSKLLTIIKKISPGSKYGPKLMIEERPEFQT